MGASYFSVLRVLEAKIRYSAVVTRGGLKVRFFENLNPPPPQYRDMEVWFLNFCRHKPLSDDPKRGLVRKNFLVTLSLVLELAYFADASVVPRIGGGDFRVFSPSKIHNLFPGRVLL